MLRRFWAKLNASSSAMLIWKCLAISGHPSTAPTAWPIAAATAAAEAPVKAKVGVPTDFSETAARLACLKVTLADASILRKLRALHPAGTCPHCVLLEACWV